MIRHLLVLTALTAFAIMGCAKQRSTRRSAPPKAVEAYCPYVGAPQTFSPAITVTGTARYQFRANGNGAINTTGNPIRRAEVMVRDTGGTIVQCAETDESGAFTLQLPANGSTYQVQVNARANNEHVKAYVMTNPNDNAYYGISTGVVADGNKTIALVATAASDTALLGGAFNILDKIYESNKFLREKVTTTECTPVNTAFSVISGAATECVPFSVAPLAYVYWTKGYNPGEYLGSSSAASFYLKGTNELYILGGIGGNVDEEDCDHFDNTIIIHEYGHFIENFYTVSDSPGGVHRPNQVLDPRLAWSEAWANFFQAAVLVSSGITTTPVYRDTEGNIDGQSTSAFLNENLETGTYDPVTGNSAIRADEGNFREFSITRILWDGFDSDTTGDADGVLTPFARIWAVITGENVGIRASSNRFRNVGTFHFINQQLGTPSWATLISNARQRGDTKDFANRLNVSGSCSTIAITAKAQTTGSFENSDLFSDNDFYWYRHTGGPLKVTLDYTTGTPAADLDLIVWKDGFTYGDLANDTLGSSRAVNDGRDEEVNVSNASAGDYMINVMVNTVSGAGAASNYSIKINGQNACPTF